MSTGFPWLDKVIDDAVEAIEKATGREVKSGALVLGPDVSERLLLHPDTPIIYKGIRIATLQRSDKR